jgi:hypothetical protein
MKALRRIIGVIQVLLAATLVVTMARNLPNSWHSTDPKAASKLYTDIFLVIVNGAGGILLLKEPKKTE